MWANKYEKCIECKETKYKHKARGLCTSCYDKKRAKEFKRRQCLRKSHKKRYDENRDNQEILEARRGYHKKRYENKKEVVLLAKKARYRQKNGLPHMIMRVNGIEYPLPFETINSKTDKQYILLKEYYENL